MPITYSYRLSFRPYCILTDVRNLSCFLKKDSRFQKAFGITGMTCIFIYDVIYIIYNNIYNNELIVLYNKIHNFCMPVVYCLLLSTYCNYAALDFRNAGIPFASRGPTVIFHPSSLSSSAPLSIAT